MIWQYLKLPEESRKRVKAELINVHENCGKEDFQIPNLYDIVPKEEIAEFEDIMRKIITGIISSFYHRIMLFRHQFFEPGIHDNNKLACPFPL